MEVNCREDTGVVLHQSRRRTVGDGLEILVQIKFLSSVAMFDIFANVFNSKKRGENINS